MSAASDGGTEPHLEGYMSNPKVCLYTEDREGRGREREREGKGIGSKWKRGGKVGCEGGDGTADLGNGIFLLRS